MVLMKGFDKAIREKCWNEPRQPTVRINLGMMGKEMLIAIFALPNTESVHFLNKKGC